MWAMVALVLAALLLSCGNGGASGGTSSSGATPVDAGTAPGGSFGPGGSDCAGVMPASLGIPVSRTVDWSGSDRTFCDIANSDLQGNVAGQVSGMGPNPWTIWSADGTKLGHFNGYWVVQQNAGFQGIFYDGTTADPDQDALYAWTPSGTVLNKTVVGTSAGVSVVESFEASTGGSVVLWSSCPDPPPGVASAVTMKLVVSRFDQTGALVSTANFVGPGCVDGAIAALSDNLDRTLVVVSTNGAALGFGPPAVLARWLDRTGSALTNWFDAGPGAPFLRPLIGGGAAIRIGNHWIGSVASGATKMDTAPAFLTDGNDLFIVRGWKAYALVPLPSRGGSLDLYSPAGNYCGSVQFPGTTNLKVGADGTVISMGGSDGCTLTWWPHLLK